MSFVNDVHICEVCEVLPDHTMIVEICPKNRFSKGIIRVHVKLANISFGQNIVDLLKTLIGQFYPIKILPLANESSGIYKAHIYLEPITKKMLHIGSYENIHTEIFGTLLSDVLVSYELASYE